MWIGFPSGEIPMLSVHGIAVSGPTFPAQIWHTFMDTAIGKRPDVPFPPALTEPVWTSWHGQYQFGGAYGAYGATTSTDTTTTAGRTTTAPVTTVAPPRQTTTAPPVTTVAPPPVTTVPPVTPTEPTPTSPTP